MPTLNLSKKEIKLLTEIISIYWSKMGGSTKQETLFYNKIKRAGKRIAISSAKGKGRSLQQKICRDISEVIHIPYDQQDDECLIHSREMGQAGVDVILRGEAKRLFPFSVECKSAEQLGLLVIRNQAETNKADGTDWMIVYKCKALNGPVVIMDWNRFIEGYE